MTWLNPKVICLDICTMLVQRSNAFKIQLTGSGSRSTTRWVRKVVPNTTGGDSVPRRTSAIAQLTGMTFRRGRVPRQLLHLDEIHLIGVTVSMINTGKQNISRDTYLSLLVAWGTGLDCGSACCSRLCRSRQSDFFTFCVCLKVAVEGYAKQSQKPSQLDLKCIPDRLTRSALVIRCRKRTRSRRSHVQLMCIS